MEGEERVDVRKLWISHFPRVEAWTRYAWSAGGVNVKRTMIVMCQNCEVPISIEHDFDFYWRVAYGNRCICDLVAVLCEDCSEGFAEYRVERKLCCQCRTEDGRRAREALGPGIAGALSTALSTALQELSLHRHQHAHTSVE